MSEWLLEFLMVPAYGALMGLIVALLWPLVVKLMRRGESQRDWERLKREHGFWKAYVITLGKGMLIGAVFFSIFAVISLIRQCRGEG